MSISFKKCAIAAIATALAISFCVGFFQDMELAAMQKSYEMQMRMGEEP